MCISECPFCQEHFAHKHCQFASKSTCGAFAAASTPWPPGHLEQPQPQASSVQAQPGRGSSIRLAFTLCFLGINKSILRFTAASCSTPSRASEAAPAPGPSTLQAQHNYLPFLAHSFLFLLSDIISNRVLCLCSCIIFYCNQGKWSSPSPRALIGASTTRAGQQRCILQCWQGLFHEQVSNTAFSPGFFFRPVCIPAFLFFV